MAVLLKWEGLCMHGNRILLTLATAAMLLGGCVSHRAYRRCEHEYIQRTALYTLGIIEFDDHGEPWVPRQTYDVLTVLHELNKRPSGVVAVLYVHGWKHNASSANESGGNLARLKEQLEAISRTERAAAERDQREARSVIGIYVAWRGDSLRIPEPLKNLSFFDRFSAAHRVAASPAVTGTISAVMTVADQNNASRLVMVGHSLGGLILESALAQSFSDAMVRTQFSSRDAGSLGVAWSHPADLIVFINEAAPALQAKTVVDLFRYNGVRSGKLANPRFTCGTDSRWSPLIVSMTSETDTATKRVFPIAATLESMFHRFRRYDSAAIAMDSCENTGEHSFDLPSQSSFYRHTAGHFPILHSHELTYRRLDAAVPGSELVPRPCESKFCFAETVPAGQSDESLCMTMDGHEFRLDASGAMYNNTPYWIMRVPRDIVPGHGGIFNPTFTTLLTSVVAASGALNMSADDYLNAGWCVWHEGARVFDESMPGRRRPLSAIRAECRALQAHNPHAQSVVEKVSDEQLAAIMTALGWAVEQRFDLPRHFARVMRSGLGAEFSAMVEREEYEQIRLRFAEATRSEPNTRNLLAAVSNQRIRELVQVNE